MPLASARVDLEHAVEGRSDDHNLVPECRRTASWPIVAQVQGTRARHGQEPGPNTRSQAGTGKGRYHTPSDVVANRPNHVLGRQAATVCRQPLWLRYASDQALAAFVLLGIICTTPLMSVEKAGNMLSAGPFSGPTELAQRNMAPLAVAVVCVTVAIPLVRLVGKRSASANPCWRATCEMRSVVASAGHAAPSAFGATADSGSGSCRDALGSARVSLKPVVLDG